MNDNHNYRFKKVKDFSGHILKLTLVKKDDCPNKTYSLYTVNKIVQDENGEDVLIPLYDETFTQEQVNSFYTNSTYYTPVETEE